jgi:hypothetical protein
LDLVDSLCTFEPGIPAIVIADDSASAPRIKQALRVPDGCRVSFVRNPDSRQNFLSLGSNVLTALAHIHGSLPNGFTIKLDTDALVIGPFAARISSELKARPSTGMLGLLSNSCNRSRASLHSQDALERLVKDAVNAANHFDDDDLEVWLRRWSPGPERTVIGLRRFCQRFGALATARFRGQHCNGGSYAISSTLLERMASFDVFDDRTLWSLFPFSEDRMMGLYCALCGMQATDFSNAGQVFGTQSSGLAFTPQELVDRGYGIIHSVKNDATSPEAEIRRFFRLHREKLQRDELVEDDR